MAQYAPYAALDLNANAIVNLGLYRIYNGVDVDFDPDDEMEDELKLIVGPQQSFAIGHVFLKTNHRHKLEFHQKLWYVHAGFNSGGPVLPVFDGWHNNRAFAGMAPPRNLGRSNAASVGFLSTGTYSDSSMSIALSR